MKPSLLVFFALACLPVGAAADDAVARSLAATCANCHGTSGKSATATVESLAGQPKDRFVDLMQAFKSGKKPATIMQQIAKGYTDQQIDLMGGYFAAQKK